MIADKTVQGITTVLEVIVVLAGILRIGLVVDLLSVGFQVINVIDAMGTIDRVRFYESSVLELPILWIPRMRGCARTVGTRTINLIESFTGAAVPCGVGINGIGIIVVLRQRVSHASKTQCSTEDRQIGIVLNDRRQELAAGADDPVDDMYYAIGDRIVLLNDPRILVDIDEQRIVVKDITVRSHLDIVVIHVDRRNFSTHVSGEVGLVLHDVNTRKRVTDFHRQCLQRTIAVFAEIVLDGLIRWHENGEMTIGLKHGQVLAALENGLEVTVLCVIGLNKTCSGEPH